MGERKEQRKPRWGWGKLAMLGSWVAVGGLAFYLGRVCMMPQADAAPGRATARGQEAAAAVQPTAPSLPPREVVGYIHGTIPISRAELGEYLIARQGAERLELLINRRILEIACQQAGITVTEQEMEAEFAESLKPFGGDPKQFVNAVLKQYGKTLYEWKEDVVRPKIMLNKLSRSRVTISEDDLRMAFDAKYGEQVEGRLILWPHAEKDIAMRMYAQLRSSDEAFLAAAKQQASPSLAMVAGKIRPIGHNTTGCPELEKSAFGLQPGEMTELIGTPEGVVVFKCEKRVPADTSKNFEAVRAELEQEVLLRKTNLELGKMFQELRAAAKPVNLLRQDGPSDSERVRDVEQELKNAKIPLPRMGQTPEGPPPDLTAPMPGGGQQ